MAPPVLDLLSPPTKLMVATLHDVVLRGEELALAVLPDGGQRVARRNARSALAPLSTRAAAPPTTSTASAAAR